MKPLISLSLLLLLGCGDGGGEPPITTPPPETPDADSWQPDTGLFYSWDSSARDQCERSCDGQLSSCCHTAAGIIAAELDAGNIGINTPYALDHLCGDQLNSCLSSCGLPPSGIPRCQ